MRFIFLAALLVAGIAKSETLCESYADFAKSIMSARQDGQPMQVYIELVESIYGEDSDTDLSKESKKAMLEINRQVVIDAYSSPQMLTYSMKQRVINEFQNKAYLTCYKYAK